MKNILRSIGQFFLDFIETIVIALAIFVIVYLFLFQPHQVKGSSMYPTFVNGEYILTDKFSYRFDPPKRGEVIVFKAPQNEDYDYIKRIIALPGDTVKVENGKLYINGKLLHEETYLDDSIVTNPGSFLREGLERKVPAGVYIALGDNRQHSSDSREWGAIPQGNIIGKAWVKYWPLSSISIIKTPSYQ